MTGVASAPSNMEAVVWCGKYVHAEQGTLSLHGGNLRFETSQQLQFNVPVLKIEKIIWHWYSFSAAFEAVIDGKNYFLSFIPRGPGLGAWYAGLSTGRRWRAALEGRPLPTSPPIGPRIFLALFHLVRSFLLGCGALIALSAAMAESASLLYKILGGIMAAVSFLMSLMYLWMFLQSLRSKSA